MPTPSSLTVAEASALVAAASRETQRRRLAAVQREADEQAAFEDDE